MTQMGFSFARGLAGAALLSLCALLAACSLGEVPMAPEVAPEIRYTSTDCDTVGRPAFHPILSSAGYVLSVTISPALPPGYALDSAHGDISGTPVAPQGPVHHTVIATGPAGADTADWRLCVVPAEHSVSHPPLIAYDSPAVDTVAVAASHRVYSLSGAITSYALIHPLPAGLTLNANTGDISGTPLAEQSIVDYFVIATGPGGRDTATLRLSIVAKNSAPTDTQPPGPARPRIAYVSPVNDTVGRPASHSAISTGGSVTSYALLPTSAGAALPPGMSLNATTGLISGTPTSISSTDTDLLLPPGPGQTLSGEGTYSIVATGPGGKDTAQIVIRVWWRASGEPNIDTTTRLNVTFHLGASAPYILDKMIVTLTSSISSDPVIRDTILPGTAGFQASGADQAVLKSYEVKPLRHWTLTVKTLDQNNVAMQADSVLARDVLVAEKRAVTLNLAARYRAYSLSFTMPDSAVLGNDPPRFYELRFNRISVSLQGDTLVDTVATGAYFAARTFALRMDYVPVSAAPVSMNFTAIGQMVSVSSDYPLLDDTFSLTLPTGTSIVSQPIHWSYQPGTAAFQVAISRYGL